MQIERGTTALYVSSKGDHLVRSRLVNLYRDTDAAINKLSKWIIKDSKELSQTKYSFQRHISEFRSELNPLNITIREVIHFYTEYNAVFITMIGRSLNLRKPFNFWVDLASYQNLIISKENAGIERALGSTYFARGQLPVTDHMWYIEKRVLVTYFLQQSRQYSEFTASSIDSLFQGTDLQAHVSSMQQRILDNTAAAPSVEAGKVWFDKMTGYINILQNVQGKLANNIVQAAAEENSSLLEAMAISAIQFTIGILIVPVIIVLVRNIINLIKKIKNFSEELQDKTCELEAEKYRTEELLYQLLPSCISPMQVVTLLNSLFTAIDTRLKHFDVYKVETIGDGYMVASGLPRRNGEKHVAEIARFALDLLTTMQELKMPHLPEKKMCLRLGFNTGPVVAGVVGMKMPRYCLFGDTVNTASRMESTGQPSRIHMTESSAEGLGRIGGFNVSERGTVKVKGKRHYEDILARRCLRSTRNHSKPVCATECGIKADELYRLCFDFVDITVQPYGLS